MALLLALSVLVKEEVPSRWRREEKTARYVASVLMVMFVALVGLMVGLAFYGLDVLMAGAV